MAYADWSNPFDEQANDYIRTFAITDPEQFAGDVGYAMEREREDGSTPLSDFLDKMAEAALDDGSMGAEYEQRITHGTFSQLETWSKDRREKRQPAPRTSTANKRGTAIGGNCPA